MLLKMNVKCILLLLVHLHFVFCHDIVDDREIAIVPITEEEDPELINPHSLYKKNRHQADYVNPHSLYYNKLTKKERVPSSEPLSPQWNQKAESSSTENKNEEMSYKVYYDRLIQAILSHIYYTEKEEYISGQISVEATIKELDILRYYTVKNISLKEVDQILINMFKLPIHSFDDQTLNIFSIIWTFIEENKFYLYFTVLLAVLLLIIWKFCSTTRSIVIFVLMCILSHSWYVTHQDMVKEVNYKNEFDQIKYNEKPITCTPEKMTWVQKSYLYQLLFVQPTDEDCFNYIKARTPMIEVTLVHSFAKMCSKCIFDQLSIFGKSLNQFIENFTQGMNPIYKFTIFALIGSGIASLPIMLIPLVVQILSVSVKVLPSLASRTLNPRTPEVPRRIESVERYVEKDILRIKKCKNKNKISLEIGFNKESATESNSETDSDENSMVLIDSARSNKSIKKIKANKKKRKSSKVRADNSFEKLSISTNSETSERSQESQTVENKNDVSPKTDKKSEE